MKAISLTQPWATLVAAGAKRIETRSWPTSYRGMLLIHAAKGLASVGGAQGLVDVCLNEPFRSALVAAGAGRLVVGQDLPLGAIIGACNLHKVGKIGRRADGAVIIRGYDRVIDGDEAAFGDYTPGRYGWVLTNIAKLREPIPCRGALGVWTAPVEVEAQVRAQFGKWVF